MKVLKLAVDRVKIRSRTGKDWIQDDVRGHFLLRRQVRIPALWSQIFNSGPKIYSNNKGKFQNNLKTTKKFRQILFTFISLRLWLRFFAEFSNSVLGFFCCATLTSILVKYKSFKKNLLKIDYFSIKLWKNKEKFLRK